MAPERTIKKQTERMRTLCSAIIRNDGKVLLIKRADYNVWELPSGGIEFAESPKETVTREVKEETGLIVEPERLVDVISVYFENSGVGVLEKNHLIVIVYECRLPDYGHVGRKKEIILDSDHDEYQWVDPKCIPEIKNLAIGMKDIMGALISDIG